MQRGSDSLYRATPIPGTEPLPARKASGSLSAHGSIAEDEEEEQQHDSADSLAADRMLPRQSPSYRRTASFPIVPKGLSRRGSGNGGLSTITSEEYPTRVSPGVRGAMKSKATGSSGPSSPTVSESSDGSGNTFRSADSLHRLTPMPLEASSTHAMGGSFKKPAAFRSNPITPTISEAGSPPRSPREGERRDSLGNLLHRPTPIPQDMHLTNLVSSGSLRRSDLRPATPTIQEDDDALPDRDETDDSEHYYGRPSFQNGDDTDGGSLYATPRDSVTEVPPPRQHAAAAASKLSQETSGQAAGRTTVRMSPPIQQILERAPTAVANTRGTGGSSPAKPVAVNVDVDQPGPVASAPAPPARSVHLLESKDWERDIVGVARFLRMCPGLSRQIIGDLLGENNERCLRVLETFTATFDFTDLPFETALREYLESFRLPGEAQKIYRILDFWSRQFFQQCPGIFKTADAVHVLAFSLVILNTDKHNSTVKRKMTCEEFVRNNRGINGGEDLPREFLEELYNNIERRAIRIPAAHPHDAISPQASLTLLPEPLRVQVAQERKPPAASAARKLFWCL